MDKITEKDFLIHSFMNEFQEMIYSSSNKELDSILTRIGKNPSNVVRSARERIKEAETSFRKNNLALAKQRYKQASNDYGRINLQLPMDQLRKLYNQVVSSHPELSLQFRNVSQLTDHDIESSVKHFIQLGLFVASDLDAKNNE